MSARILIIEDNQVNRELIDYLLQACGFTTLKAVDGLIGLDIAQRERPDLILCDIQMPRLDGIEFARRAKADPRLSDTPLIAVTALAMVGDRDYILAQGFDGYITKPIDPADFLATVQAFIAARTPCVPAPPPTAHAPLDTPLSPRRILVLDDTPMNLELKRDLLGPKGYTVITTQTAAQAWEAAQASPPDLVISDVSADQGFDLIQRMQADAALRKVPFIFLTASHWDEDSRQKGLQLGAKRYLTRPIEPTRLLVEIEACLPPR